MSSTDTKISRRTIARGAAWAAPAVAVVGVAPVAAASTTLPPCVGGASGTSQSAWSVPTASFGSCSTPSHFDVNIRMTIKECNASQVCIRVYDLGDEGSLSGQGAQGLRSRLWWSLRDAPSPRFLFIEKCVAVPTPGATLNVNFAVENDVVRYQNSLPAPTPGVAPGGGSTQGTIAACCNNENDGIHVNPCYFGGIGSVSRVAKYYTNMQVGGTWSGWQYGGYINATRTV